MQISVLSFFVVNGLFFLSGLVWGFIAGQLRHRHRSERGPYGAVEVRFLRLQVPGENLRAEIPVRKTDRGR